MPDDLTAKVIAVEPCPEIEDGPGQVILTTVSHLNRFVFRLTVKDASGKSESLGVTGYHKFYSESRKAWVSAKDLNNGERLGYLQRPVTVAALQQLPGTHRVYNLTVENEHVYYVSGMGALVHNSNCGPNWVNGTTKNPVQLEDFRAPNRGPLWTATKNKSGVENAFGHFKKHGAEFPEFPNATQYAQGARNFVTNPPAGTLTKVRPNGDKLFFDPATNTFAVQRADGALRTMFRPTDGINYWNKQ